MGNLSNGSGAGAESAATAGAPVMSAVCQTTVSQSTRQVRMGGETVMAALESPKGERSETEFRKGLKFF